MRVPLAVFEAARRQPGTDEDVVVLFTRPEAAAATASSADGDAGSGAA